MTPPPARPPAGPRRKRARFRHRHLGRPWTLEIVLPDGRRLVQRPICPGDAEGLRHAFARLTPEEVRMRFLHPMKSLGPELVERLVNVRPESGLALVLERLDVTALPPLGGVARCMLDDGGREAEFAIIIARDLSGQGLGHWLMRRLVEWCRRRGLDAIYGDVLDENTHMLRLARELGFRAYKLRDEGGVLRVYLPLGKDGRGAIPAAGGYVQ